ncbi:sulfite exporter TauE/SafE family protein [Streptomyces sp. NBC_00887]|uniref:urease accessory protein UreH domain-containing protein n=1 Tax=Streptomyces sp. NBC_00887 TaxID=2975859 RepID=UPI003869516E|nr:sulfite exporter TauE/SafE family protein [Streptomyces sp. NBC_00887]WSY36326.1 sulfite exporter TauE/SafE family protein [Streptomyces sp. NBC_00887]
MRVLHIRVLLLLIAVSALLFCSAGTAQAHPFGTPPVVSVAAKGTAVDVTWSAQQDDVAVLREESGGDEAGYLRSHIVVRQDARPCRAEPVNDPELGLHFVCPKPVDRIALTVTALTDVNPAYRTLSVTDSGSGALHTAEEPTRSLALTSADADSGPDAEIWSWSTDLTSLLDHGAALPVALLVAAAVGALHACAPGHGKSVAAGYLVAGRGRPRDAVWLGGIVALMHTFSVAALAVGWWLAADSFPDIAALTRWLQLTAALVVVAVGTILLQRHVRHRKHHDHGHGHTRRIPNASSLLTWRGLLLLGVSGGLLPSPSAFLVLVTGLLTGKAAVALALVAAFGLGMALTLTGVGLIVLRGRDALLDRLSHSRVLRTWSQRTPLFAASAVVTAGTVASALAAARLTGP